MLAHLESAPPPSGTERSAASELSAEALPERTAPLSFEATAADGLGAGGHGAAAGDPEMVWQAEGTSWYWQVLPDGLLYKSYLANNQEPRFATRWMYVRDEGWLWDSALGGRMGVLRFGSDHPSWPEGWQIDIEGAAFPRLDPEDKRDLVSADFRFGVPLTHRRGRWEWKFGYYHLSSHLGDEYMLKHDRQRSNYARDCLVFGTAWYPWPDLRLYAEADFAFILDGGARPWAFQFGADYSPIKYTGFWGAPFLAVNGHLRQENDFGGNFTFQTGWQWRGPTGHLMRVGLHYLSGSSNQYQFAQEHEDQVGIGLWYDY